MRYLWLWTLLAGASFFAAAAPPAKKTAGSAAHNAEQQGSPSTARDAKPGENLIPNGDFEEGAQKGPRHWQIADGLCSFWVKDSDPKHGMVMKFDTDVSQKEAYAWWVKIAQGASPKNAPKKTPPVGSKY